MFKGTGLKALNLYQEPQSALKKNMGKFDEADIQKAYTQTQGKYDETVTTENISLQIGRKLQTRTNTAPPLGFNIAPSKDPYITPGLTQ